MDDIGTALIVGLFLGLIAKIVSEVIESLNR